MTERERERDRERDRERQRETERDREAVSRRVSKSLKESRPRPLLLRKVVHEQVFQVFYIITTTH